jgi:hypothetical protein
VVMDRQVFEEEADRILQSADREDVMLRLLGAVAFRRHCGTYGHLQDRLGRTFTDIDFAGYGKQAGRISALMRALGYQEDSATYVESAGSRLVFGHPETSVHVDVFLDKLEFCHTIQWNGRLEIDSPTIPLAELLMEKLQIVEINEKDVIDSIMLLLEHPLGDSDDETINVGTVTALCASDWGWWRTTTMNLEKVRLLADGYEQLSAEEKARVAEQVGALRARIDEVPKNLGWRLRAKVGDRKKWYRDVGELAPEV